MTIVRSLFKMKLQPECISQIAEIIFRTRSNVQAKTMYQERRWRNEEGSNFRTCRYSSIGFRCVWKKCCNGNSSDSGVSTVSASSQVENGQKATRVNQGTNLSPGSPKNIPSGGGNSSGRTHHSETHHSETHHSDAHHD